MNWNDVLYLHKLLGIHHVEPSLLLYGVTIILRNQLFHDLCFAS